MGSSTPAWDKQKASAFRRGSAALSDVSVAQRGLVRSSWDFITRQEYGTAESGEQRVNKVRAPRPPSVAAGRGGT
jgi:hypothetical protein